MRQEKQNIPPLALIAARGRNGVIGHQGRLAWHLPTDLKRFKKRTLGKPVLMGRKTWESLKTPLPGRPNLVLTRKTDYHVAGVHVFTDFMAMLAHARVLAEEYGAQEIIIMGGESLYCLAFPYATRLYITEVDASVQGDAWFPDFDESNWHEVEREAFAQTSRDDHAFIIRTLIKKV